MPLVTIHTSFGPITACQKGTIQMNVVSSTSAIYTVQFTEVLYALDIFVTVLLRSKLRQKGVYYQGRVHKLWRLLNDDGIAYAPEIDNIPTFLIANVEEKTARHLAFVATHVPGPSGPFVYCAILHSRSSTRSSGMPRPEISCAELVC